MYVRDPNNLRSTFTVITTLTAPTTGLNPNVGANPKRVSIIFPPSINAALYVINDVQQVAFNQGFTISSGSTPFRMDYEDTGELVQSPFYVIANATNTVTIIEIIDDTFP